VQNGRYNKSVISNQQTGDREMSRFSVWVGGVEINDYDINTREEAENLANFWRQNQDYDDVVIEERPLNDK
jgi:hypothetical protein